MRLQHSATQTSARRQSTDPFWGKNQTGEQTNRLAVSAVYSFVMMNYLHRRLQSEQQGRPAGE